MRILFWGHKRGREDNIEMYLRGTGLEELKRMV